MPRESGEPAVFELARRHAKELDAQLKPRIPTLRVKIKGGNVSRVAIDDIEIPASIVGEPIAVNPGKRLVVAKNGEGAEARGEIDLAEREAKELELTLPHGDLAKSAPLGTSSSSTAPHSSTPATTVKVSVGNDDADTREGRRAPLAKGLMYGGAGLAAAGIVVGSITGAMTISKASDVTQQCENDICAPSARDGLDRATTLATVSTIGFIAAGVGVAAVVVGLLLPKQASSPSAAATTRALPRPQALPRLQALPLPQALWIGAAGIGGRF
jgi:hypothetical protein